MCHLMVGYGKGAACATIEQFKAQFLASHDPLLLAKYSVKVNGLVDRRDPVLGYNDDSDGALLEKVYQISDDGVDGSQVIRYGWIGRAKPLQIVIEVREINQAQSWLIFVFDPFC